MTNGREPTKNKSDAPQSFCTIHTNEKLSHVADRIAHRKVNGVWTDIEEPIIECVKCIFSD